MGAESKQSPPGGADVDELDDEAEPTTSGLALKPKAPVFDDDEEEEREERTELQMDAELVARARHRLLFGRAKPPGTGDPNANAAPGAKPAEPPRPAAALAAPGIPRRLPTPAPGTIPANAAPPAATGPTAPPRPAPGAPGPLLSPNVAGPGIARRLPTPPPGSIQSPYGAGPGVPPRGPTPSPGSAVRPRSGTLIGHSPQGAGPGIAPRAPTPTPAPSSPLHAPAPFPAAGAADVSQSRRAMASDSGLVPAPATPAVGEVASSGDDDFVVQPLTVENGLPIPGPGESADLLGSIATVPSDAAITDENPVAPPLDVPEAFAPAPALDGAPFDPNAAPPAFAPPAAPGDAWSQPGASVSSQGRTGNTGVTGMRKRPKRAPIEYVAMGIAGLAVLWAIWLILFYHR